jgi:alkylation response protein AidB-like acyl-CoA dehydrogenase
LAPTLRWRRRATTASHSVPTRFRLIFIDRGGNGSRSRFAMTEPAVASSDATNVESRIDRQGDHYVVNGRKWWATGGPDRCASFSFSWARPIPTTRIGTASRLRRAGFVRAAFITACA